MLKRLGHGRLWLIYSLVLSLPASLQAAPAEEILLLKESIQSRMEQLRIHSLTIDKLFDYAGKKKPVPRGAIFHWTRAELGQAGTLKISQKASNPRWTLKGLEHLYLKKVIQQIQNPKQMKQLKRYGVNLLPVSLPYPKKKHWIAHILLKNNKGSSRILIALAKASSLFSVLSKLKTLSKTEMRSFLIHQSGVVIAHSLPEHNGLDLSKESFFRSTIQNRFSASSQKKIFAQSFDENEVELNSLLVPSFPLLLVTETPRKGLSATVGTWFSVLLIVAGLSGLIFAVTLLWGTRRKKQESFPPLLEEETLPLPQEKNEPKTYFTLNELDGVLLEGIEIKVKQGRENKKQTHRKQKMSDEFELEAPRIRHPQMLISRLTEAVSDLCQSPVLFFSFHESIKRGVLMADAGFPVGKAPVTLSFPMDIRSVLKILEISKRGQVASLSRYQPLSSLLTEQLSVGHFEAWAVTSQVTQRLPANHGRLIGILVILESGLESTKSRDRIMRMILTSGLVYGQNETLT